MREQRDDFVDVGGAVHAHEHEIVALRDNVGMQLARTLRGDEQMRTELAAFSGDECAEVGRRRQERVVGRCGKERCAPRRRRAAPACGRRRAPSDAAAGRTSSSPSGDVAANGLKPASRRPTKVADPVNERKVGLTASGTTSLTSRAMDNPFRSRTCSSRTCTTSRPPRASTRITSRSTRYTNSRSTLPSKLGLRNASAISSTGPSCSAVAKSLTHSANESMDRSHRWTSVTKGP